MTVSKYTMVLFFILLNTTHYAKTLTPSTSKPLQVEVLLGEKGIPLPCDKAAYNEAVPNPQILNFAKTVYKFAPKLKQFHIRIKPTAISTTDQESWLQMMLAIQKVYPPGAVPAFGFSPDMSPHYPESWPGCTKTSNLQTNSNCMFAKAFSIMMKFNSQNPSTKFTIFSATQEAGTIPHPDSSAAFSFESYLLTKACINPAINNNYTCPAEVISLYEGGYPKGDTGIKFGVLTTSYGTSSNYTPKSVDYSYPEFYTLRTSLNITQDIAKLTKGPPLFNGGPYFTQKLPYFPVPSSASSYLIVMEDESVTKSCMNGCEEVPLTARDYKSIFSDGNVDIGAQYAGYLWAANHLDVNPNKLPSPNIFPALSGEYSGSGSPYQNLGQPVWTFDNLNQLFTAIPARINWLIDNGISVQPKVSGMGISIYNYEQIIYNNCVEPGQCQCQ